MNVFLTGATGCVGSAVLDALVRGGHHVTALVRDPATAEHLMRWGVQPVIGELSSPTSYVRYAESCDGTIHAAFDSSKRGESIDRLALDALLPAVGRHASRGRERTPFFIYTSATWVIGG